MTATYIDNLVRRIEGDEGSPQREIWDAHLRFLVDQANEQDLSPANTRGGLQEELTRRLAVLDANGSRQARTSRRPPPAYDLTMDDVQIRRGQFEEQMASSASQSRQTPQHVQDHERNAFERALQLSTTHDRNPFEQRLQAPERDPVDQGPQVLHRYPRGYGSSNVLAHHRNQFGYGPSYATGDAENPPIAPTARMTNGEDTPPFPPPSYGSFPVPHIPNIVRGSPGPHHLVQPPLTQGQSHWTSSIREFEYGEAQTAYWGHHHHFHHHHFHHPAPRASHSSPPRYQPPTPQDVPSYQNIRDWDPTNRGRGGRGFMSQTRGGRGFPFQNWRGTSGRGRAGGIFGGRGSSHMVPPERTAPSIRTTDTPAPGMVTSHRGTPSSSRTTDTRAPHIVPPERTTSSSSRAPDIPAPGIAAPQRELFGNSRSLDTLASNTPNLHGASSTGSPSLLRNYVTNYPFVLADAPRPPRRSLPSRRAPDLNVSEEETGEEPYSWVTNRNDNETR